MPGVTIVRPETLPREPINHPVGASKMVFIPGGNVPPLSQFAQAWFSKGDRVEPHSHDVHGFECIEESRMIYLGVITGD